MSLTNSSAAQVDVRGPRFAAWITTAVLVAVLVIASFAPPVAGILLAAQTVVFALGAALGPRRSPYGALFATVVAPRVGPPSETEPTPPLRFAQGVGFAFALIGTVALLTGAVTLGIVAAGFALFAALLNAAFGVCLGCRIYPLIARLRPQTT
ncbi:DUF4395 domain-containing protein [Rhodococcus artemisiae]|uniref:DUF4395 domain-containing protein n=1 Tax=Rhodococcus artemisiae TaxID=714159 RepID=A0ABU7LGG1_9NOCA|nr:DUF4395 domain-containing protein [Rhodococcus artemisiae]MEE2060643.1 DUF4395 domain-containing protein [Rhodococcus artemisiae]